MGLSSRALLLLCALQYRPSPSRYLAAFFIFEFIAAMRMHAIGREQLIWGLCGLLCDLILECSLPIRTKLRAEVRPSPGAFKGLRGPSPGGRLSGRIHAMAFILSPAFHLLTPRRFTVFHPEEACSSTEFAALATFSCSSVFMDGVQSWTGFQALVVGDERIFIGRGQRRLARAAPTPRQRSGEGLLPMGIWVRFCHDIGDISLVEVRLGRRGLRPPRSATTMA